MKSTDKAATRSLPRVGMMAIVRNRRGIITSVDAFDTQSEEGTLHLVQVEYTDFDGERADSLIWEREVAAEVLEPNALPRFGDTAPMAPDEFDAFVSASRWSALSPFVDIDDPTKRSPVQISAPFQGAVQIDDFQLTPLVKALEMPRVSLLIADDVGLGKTIEAALILKELLLRRRIRRVLILTPAALRDQWTTELEGKFSLSFERVDRESTLEIRRQFGLDANPWRVFPHIIASYYYLRQPDILEQFLSTCRRSASSTTALMPTLPWDLLIVDEAHNLTPSNFGDDSDLVHMLQTITPYFEHKIFLTATPHNGHTRSFTGLLELLDPVRFTRTSELRQAERERIREVVVRRLKRDVNDADRAADRYPRFPERTIEPLQVEFHEDEQELSAAVAEFKKRLRSRLASQEDAERRAGAFAAEILTKRLLSCPVAFANSWRRLRSAIADELDAESDSILSAVESSRRVVDEDIDDDIEKDSRDLVAAETVGQWLIPHADALRDEITRIDKALQELQLLDNSEPNHDSRYDALLGLIRDRLLLSKKGHRSDWTNDERIVVFTEYKTTLDYLLSRLAVDLADDGSRIRSLFGGMASDERERVKKAFNDAGNPVRVLLGTDAASEGLNLHQTARLLLHFDIPWNPSRLEQRNGRLDRHGQARDVTVFHFTSDDDVDLKFLGHVVAKAHTIREDLGSMGEIFDEAFSRRFVGDAEVTDVLNGIDAGIQWKRTQNKQSDLQEMVAEPSLSVTGSELAHLQRRIGLTPDNVRRVLDVAVRSAGGGKLEEQHGRYFVRSAHDPGWQEIIDSFIREKLDRKGGRGALRGMVFDLSRMMVTINSRPVFREMNDTVLMHIGHAVMQKAFQDFAQWRFPGSPNAETASRWTVRQGSVPDGCESLILVHVEELGINLLNEPFHHWVRTIPLMVKNGQVERSQTEHDDAGMRVVATKIHGRARLVLENLQLDIRRVLGEHSILLNEAVTSVQSVELNHRLAEETEAFENRIREVREAKKKTTVESLKKELRAIKEDLQQRLLLDEMEAVRRSRASELEEEITRREQHYDALASHLTAEKERVLDTVLPKRHAVAGSVQVYPVAVELVLPEGTL